jgi:hypothetical protein
MPLSGSAMRFHIVRTMRKIVVTSHQTLTAKLPKGFVHMVSLGSREFGMSVSITI